MGRFVAAVVLTLLLACTPKQVLSERVQVMDMGNQIVHTIDDAAGVAIVANALNTRIRAIVKKQPEFRYRLQWQRDQNVNQIWLYDGFGFVAQDGKEYDAIYRVDDVTTFNQVLQVSVSNTP